MLFTWGGSLYFLYYLFIKRPVSFYPFVLSSASTPSSVLNLIPLSRLLCDLPATDNHNNKTLSKGANCLVFCSDYGMKQKDANYDFKWYNNWDNFVEHSGIFMWRSTLLLLGLETYTHKKITLESSDQF